MSQVSTHTTTKSGTSKTDLAAEIVENNQKAEKGITRSEKNEFLELISDAIDRGPEPGNAMPEIEVPRKMIEHFNKVNMRDFDKTHYFIFHNVRVYEEGKRAGSKAAEKQSLEDRFFGGYRK